MADKLNDVVYTDDSKETVDVINLLLLGWILLGLIVYIIGTVVATQLRKRKTTFSTNENELSDGTKSEPTEHVSSESESKSFSSEVSSENLPAKKPLIIPTCCGDEPELVDWINSVFYWLYKNRVISPVIDSWKCALNARTRLLSTEHGLLVHFKDINVESSSLDVQEAAEVCSSRGDLNLLCDMDIEHVNLDGTITQVKDNDKVVTPFSLNVKRVSGKINIDCNPDDLSFVARYSDKPKIELFPEVLKEAAATDESSEVLDATLCEICTEALSTCIVDLKLSCYAECPRLMLKSNAFEDDVYEQAEAETEKKLLVKVIKATNLGGTEGCVQPFCIIEMDDPPQKFETTALSDKHNPFWDESFTFTVKDISAELLFEIYDKGKPSNENFLGLGIVSVDELIKNPSQRQIIPLQSRPLEDDDVTGSLTTEFLFLNQISPVTDSTHLVQRSFACDGKTVETNSRITSGGTVITTTTIKRTAEENSSRSNRPLLAAPIIMPVHEYYQDLLLNKKPTEPSVLHNSDDLSNKNLSNGVLLNGGMNNDLLCASMSKNKNSSEDVNNSFETAQPIKPACPPPLHVHDKTSNNGHGTDDSVAAVECSPILESNTHTNFQKTEEPVLLLNGGHSAVLPPISEIVESSCPAASLKGVENNLDAEADLTGTALKELEKISKPNSSTSKSTLIIHSVQRAADSSVSESLEASPASHLSKDSCTSYSESAPSSPSQDRSGDDRSRPKDKKSLFGSLRRKLSFRKTRSKSTENRSESSNYSQGSSRSASSDRLKSKNHKSSPIKGKFIGSTRSSLSEMSGISGSSSRTYINENSTLVVETNENGIIKRYLIPNSLIHRSKWKKRGTKLHIFNDHVFVAKHLSGSTECKVCKKYLTRRPGKQGYECRGCNLQCHKSCHVKVENYCSNSSINSMEVEYIHDPVGATPKSI